MAHQGTGIADIDQVAHELRAFDETHARLGSAPDAKRKQPRGAPHLAFAKRMLRMAGQTGIVHEGHPRVIHQKSCDGERVVAVPLHA
jgi:hypothetical protein